MNSFYDGYSGDAFILMVRMLYLSFLPFLFCIPSFPEKDGSIRVCVGKDLAGGPCVTIFHAFNILIIR